MRLYHILGMIWVKNDAMAVFRAFFDLKSMIICVLRGEFGEIWTWWVSINHMNVIYMNMAIGSGGFLII